jgi:aromatic ring-opening dioxygenase LigB subunit
MSNTYTWTILSLEGYETFENNTNVISNVDWICTGTDGTNTAQICGTVPIVYSSTNTFIPLSFLKQEEIISWVQTILGTTQIAKIENNLDVMIQNLNSFKIVNINVPLDTNHI